MRTVTALVLALLLPVAALAADADSEKAAGVAQSWLRMVDAADYARSWDTASTLLQKQVSEAQWETSGKAAREPLGPLLSRAVAGVDFAGTLPGAPDGRYAVVRFSTHFANKAAATETIALVMENGTWKTAGYHVR